MPEDTKTGGDTGKDAAADGGKDTVRQRDEVALELMKFVAITTGYGKGNTSGAGFSGKPAKTSEEYADALIQLFERCRAVVAKPVPEQK